jgi:SAM-dependent methyltransferase
VTRLQAGARVLDVGFGLGSASLMIADAFPRAEVHGVDPLEESVRAAAARAGGRATFAVGTATDYAADGWDLVCFFDALHDMGDPLAAAQHARKAVADDGTVMFVEPAAGDRLDDNLHPVGLTYYAASTAFCVPGALSHPVPRPRPHRRARRASRHSSPHGGADRGRLLPGSRSGPHAVPRGDRGPALTDLLAGTGTRGAPRSRPGGTEMVGDRGPRRGQRLGTPRGARPGAG